MTCRGCGSETAYAVRTMIHQGIPHDSCDRCGAAGFMTVSDVFFDKPGLHHGLYDASGSPIYVTSKGHKAYEMKKLNLQEAGDRVHGATSFDPLYSRIAKQNFRRQLEKGD